MGVITVKCHISILPFCIVLHFLITSVLYNHISIDQYVHFISISLVSTVFLTHHGISYCLDVLFRFIAFYTIVFGIRFCLPMDCDFKYILYNSVFNINPFVTEFLNIVC